jgi:hypothetical protein
MWVPNEHRARCACRDGCGREFGWSLLGAPTKHHCRACGDVVCAECSSRSILMRVAIAADEYRLEPCRVCDYCFKMRQEAPPDADPTTPNPSLLLLSREQLYRGQPAIVDSAVGAVTSIVSSVASGAQAVARSVLGASQQTHN